MWIASLFVFVSPPKAPRSVQGGSFWLLEAVRRVWDVVFPAGAFRSPFGSQLSILLLWDLVGEEALAEDRDVIARVYRTWQGRENKI